MIPDLFCFFSSEKLVVFSFPMVFWKCTCFCVGIFIYFFLFSKLRSVIAVHLVSIWKIFLNNFCFPFCFFSPLSQIFLELVIQFSHLFFSYFLLLCLYALLSRRLPLLSFNLLMTLPLPFVLSSKISFLFSFLQHPVHLWIRHFLISLMMIILFHWVLLILLPHSTLFIYSKMLCSVREISFNFYFPW